MFYLPAYVTMPVCPRIRAIDNVLVFSRSNHQVESTLLAADTCLLHRPASHTQSFSC